MNKRNVKFNYEKLKQERLKMGLSFFRFAEMLREYEPKADKSICWQWEQGKHAPSSRYLIAICSIFKKRIDFFYS